MRKKFKMCLIDNLSRLKAFDLQSYYEKQGIELDITLLNDSFWQCYDYESDNELTVYHELVILENCKEAESIAQRLNQKYAPHFYAIDDMIIYRMHCMVSSVVGDFAKYVINFDYQKYYRLQYNASLHNGAGDFLLMKKKVFNS